MYGNSWTCQVGWDCGQPDLAGGVPAHSRAMDLVIVRAPSNPNHSEIPAKGPKPHRAGLFYRHE